MALKINPNAISMSINVGIYLFSVSTLWTWGKHKEAELMLDKALKLNPKKSHILFLLKRYFVVDRYTR